MKLTNTMLEMLLETKKWREKGTDRSPPICTPVEDEDHPFNSRHVCEHIECGDCVFFTVEKLEQAILELEEIRKIQAMRNLIGIKQL